MDQKIPGWGVEKSRMSGLLRKRDRQPWPFLGFPRIPPPLSESQKVEYKLWPERMELKYLTEKYRDIPMSLADACIVRMSEIHDSAFVFTLDSDFRIYRLSRLQNNP